jgi:heat shock protein HslJ
MTKKGQTIFLVVVTAAAVLLILGSLIVSANRDRQTEDGKDDVGRMGVDRVSPSNTPVAAQPQAGKPTPPQIAPVVKPPTEPMPAPMNGPLFGTAWQFQRTTTPDKKIFAPIKLKEFVLEFETSERLTSNTDCNTVGGSYTAAEGYMTVGPLMMTKMYCVGSEESRYASDLGKAIRYSVSGNTLTLTLKDNAGTMTFTRITPTP